MYILLLLCKQYYHNIASFMYIVQCTFTIPVNNVHNYMSSYMGSRKKSYLYLGKYFKKPDVEYCDFADRKKQYTNTLILIFIYAVMRKKYI